VPRNHGPDEVPKAGKTNHGDVDDKEENEEIGDKEVKGARGLLAAKDGNEGQVNPAIQDANPGGEKVQVATPSGWAASHERERQIKDRGSSNAAGFSPVKTRMGQQNGEATNQQSKDTRKPRGHERMTPDF
jgi:hypothetical protein